MSHFSQVSTKLSNKEYLVAALTDEELQPKVFDIPQPLTGYYGSFGEESAEIVVFGRTIRAHADIGFRWNDCTGVYDLIHDSYETTPRLGSNFFTHRLLEKYAEHAIRAKAAELEEKLGACTITPIPTETGHTLKLTFAAHQQVQQYQRR